MWGLSTGSGPQLLMGLRPDVSNEFINLILFIYSNLNLFIYLNTGNIMDPGASRQVKLESGLKAACKSVGRPGVQSPEPAGGQGQGTTVC